MCCPHVLSFSHTCQECYHIWLRLIICEFPSKPWVCFCYNMGQIFLKRYFMQGFINFILGIGFFLRNKWCVLVWNWKEGPVQNSKVASSCILQAKAAQASHLMWVQAQSTRRPEPRRMWLPAKVGIWSLLAPACTSQSWLFLGNKIWTLGFVLFSVSLFKSEGKKSHSFYNVVVSWSWFDSSWLSQFLKKWYCFVITYSHIYMYMFTQEKLFASMQLCLAIENSAILKFCCCLEYF